MDAFRQDEFWENRLGQTIRDAESDPEAQAWDTPSESVWEGVSGALEEKRRRLPLLLWWGSLAAVVLLTLGGLLLVLENKAPVPHPQAEKGEVKIPGKGSVSGQAETESTIYPPAPANSETQLQRRLFPRHALVQFEKLIDNQSNTNIDQSIASPNSLQTFRNSANDPTALASTQQGKKAMENEPISTNFEPVTPIAMLETAIVSRIPESMQFLAIPVKPVGAKIQWWAGVRGGPVYAANAVRTNQPGALLFRQQETSQWSSERGLNLKMVLPSGWYAQAGLSRYDIRQSASQVFRLRFERAREQQLPSGEWESTFALSVPSSYGDSEAEIDLRRDDSNVLQEGQVLVVETETTQSLQYLSYSIGSGFLKSSGRWMYGAGAGIALNVLQEREFTLTARSRQAGIRLPVTRIRRSFSEASNNTTDLQVSATLGYRISPRWMVGLEPTLRHSLSPVVRHSGFATTTTSAGLQLSVHYLL
ncbi:MAG: hypothetical protein SGI94_22160 [Saprospiraceae bacterium]|nr:hypothetical protein [Saprospiraceae bacterium]